MSLKKLISSFFCFQQIPQVFLLREEFTVHDSPYQTDSCGVNGGYKVQINYTCTDTVGRNGSKILKVASITQVTSL
jgi:hypothetical protein